ncbi:FUSC family protein [Streptomyces yaizuensis]|uniref:FUSC family protein n=1 Tax=Streptomyces yaizuensis TaxID=2989713 RepID=A0ABQ5NR90_9ACTN|nr:FUSC family protein [Streptomyces sp. YSPA8]GLF92867.1 FUSC family protein [Streptomyces sp. YSPA8]
MEWRPQAPADWPAGVAAGAALALPLLAGTAAGHPAAGAALTLPALLVVMPLPAEAALRERTRRLGARTAAITVAGLYTFLAGGNVWALVPAIAVASAAGAVLPRVGNTAGLAMVLVGITGPVEGFGIPALPQLAGSLWGAVLLLARRGPKNPLPYRRPDRTRQDWLHAARLALLLGTASAVMAALHRLSGEAHWLLTGILLSLRPTPEATWTRARQRITGNTLGGIAAALVLLTHPGPWAVTAVVAVTGTLAYALRPANYLYWCLAFPLFLLLITDFDRPTPWYAAAVRAGLVLAGALVSIAASRHLWPPDQPPETRPGRP